MAFYVLERSEFVNHFIGFTKNKSSDVNLAHSLFILQLCMYAYILSSSIHKDIDRMPYFLMDCDMTLIYASQ